MNKLLKEMSNKIRIIPRLDIKGQNLVKGVHLEGLRVLGNPAQFASKYYADGADEIIFMDSVASLYGRNNLHHIVKSVAEEIYIPMTVGGGIRSLKDIENLLMSGADKVAINTALFRNPNLVTQVSKHFGAQCMVVSVDFVKEKNGKYMCLTDNGRERTGVELFEWVKQVVDLGAGELLLTSVDKEGTGDGYDVALTKSVSIQFNIPVITCGGAGSKEHILEVASNGSADAIAVSSVLHYDTVNKILNRKISDTGNKDFLNRTINEIKRKGIDSCSIHQLKNFLQSNNISIRMQKNLES
jgi:imidazole glycerol-phosphate synthase subunit HisF